MMLKRVIPFAHSLLETAVGPGDIAIDCTAGNGHDTVFLASLVGDSGHVYSFDIQKKALEKTAENLHEKDLFNRVQLIHDSHSNLKCHIPSEQHKVKAVIFNLGYLPGGDKTVVTRGETTIEAIEQALLLLSKGGIIAIVIYPGHEEGKTERDMVLHHLSTLDQKEVHVLKYEFINQKNNPPFVVVLEKQK